jgi:ribosome-binding protein 1
VAKFLCIAYQGRQDPVVKLKKQLAEKEKCLQEEQEAAQSLQSKLKELRSELNSERSRLTHSCRMLEENTVTKQNEIQALAARLQVMTETHVAEKQVLTQQNQQVRQISSQHVIFIFLLFYWQ